MGNRINPVTVANAAENARLASVRPKPAPSVFGPGSWVPLVSALLVGAVTAFAGILEAGGALTMGVVAWAVLRGAVLGFARFFGAKA